MRKYLELFKDGFDATIAEKTKVENWPYVGYSPGEGVVFTVVPKPVTGPADNEIWYTSSDGNVVAPYKKGVFGANIVSNTYENGKGVITFDGDVTSIGGQAFLSRKSLTSITIPNIVTSIGARAFYGCSGLTSVIIGKSVTSIGIQSFDSCSGLTSITIPNNVMSINERAFNDCSGLTSIVVEKDNPIYDSRENCNAIIETATNTLVRGCKNTTILYNVTSIGKYAFSSCEDLSSVIIKNSVVSIGTYAFVNCTGLTSIIVEDTNSIYDSRENCNAIIETTTNTLISGCQNTIIPNSVTVIGLGSFKGCENLTSITIPTSVTSIGLYAFQNCTSLNSIIYEGTTDQWLAITKESNWELSVPTTHVQCSDGQVTL